MEAYESVFSNLQLLWDMKQGYLIINRKSNDVLNIDRFICSSIYNNMRPTIQEDNWLSILEVLALVYCVRLPMLITSLLDKRQKNSLVYFSKILNKSISGLDKITSSYEDRSTITQIKDIKAKFVIPLLSKITTYLENN